jgi:hypothetical protein
LNSILLKLLLSTSLLLAPFARAAEPAKTTIAPASIAGTALAANKPLRVLFIGNSYTYYNGGMGTLVQALAAAAKDGRRLDYVEVTKGGQTLEGHWKDGKALAEIRKGGWDFVVLQEHSMRPLLDRERMWSYARQFDAEIRKVGAKTVFYETWARKNKPEMLSSVAQAYAGIAKDVAAMVAPAGSAWERALKAKPELVLHIADLSHPTPAGSYLNACVFYETFFGQSAQGLPRTIKNKAGKILVDLTESDAAILQRAACETCGFDAAKPAAAPAKIAG